MVSERSSGIVIAPCSANAVAWFKFETDGEKVSPRNDVTPLPGLPKFADLPIVVASTEELERNRDDLQREFKEVFKL